MKRYVLISCMTSAALLVVLIALAFSDGYSERYKTIFITYSGGGYTFALGDVDFDRDVDFEDFVVFSSQYGKTWGGLKKVWVRPPDAEPAPHLEKHAYRVLGYWQLSCTYWSDAVYKRLKEDTKIVLYEVKKPSHLTNRKVYVVGHALDTGAVRYLPGDPYPEPNRADAKVVVKAAEGHFESAEKAIYTLVLQWRGPGQINVDFRFVNKVDPKLTKSFHGYEVPEPVPEILGYECYNVPDNRRTEAGIEQKTVWCDDFTFKEIGREAFFQTALRGN